MSRSLPFDPQILSISLIMTVTLMCVIETRKAASSGFHVKEKQSDAKMVQDNDAEEIAPMK